MPNLVSSVSRTIVSFRAEKPEIPAASAPSSTTPGGGADRAERNGEEEHSPQPAREGARGRETRLAAPPTAVNAGNQASIRKARPPTASAVAVY